MNYLLAERRLLYRPGGCFCYQKPIFNGINTYSLGQKPYTLYFFSLFYEEMIRLICAIFTIMMKNFKCRLNNKNLFLRKNAIQFELYAQKSKKDKYFVTCSYETS